MARIFQIVVLDSTFNYPLPLEEIDVKIVKNFRLGGKKRQEVKDFAPKFLYPINVPIPDELISKSNDMMHWAKAQDLRAVQRHNAMKV